ncbi:YqzM family protein [Chengkuizengella axinellae]|uniref:YqzM family protein n=1 Tax=Chengkuizengella axinellae TaxID=3064388 RepID=A0ABT9IT99_9BACL|nr:YqzM family protein [Chengkuizengella sp. 2205SS18-9]MDP5272586.1 YqzM family protein [Chengkuizengella sp. 2205SS18-9]
MSEARQPELHVNEEPRNDFIDVGVGFAVSAGIFFTIGIIATILSVIAK